MEWIVRDFGARFVVTEIDEAVSRAESIREFRLLEGDFTQDNGLLTPSLKIRPHAVTH
ncbi:hypothetical protein H8R17_09315 [Streptomyces sp. TRM68367]|nr:hypothetical protein [Streptomyces sp. TRM68367]